MFEGFVWIASDWEFITIAGKNTFTNKILISRKLCKKSLLCITFFKYRQVKHVWWSLPMCGTFIKNKTSFFTILLISEKSILNPYLCSHVFYKLESILNTLQLTRLKMPSAKMSVCGVHWHLVTPSPYTDAINRSVGSKVSAPCLLILYSHILLKHPILSLHS